MNITPISPMAKADKNADDAARAVQAQAREWLVQLRSGNATPDDLQAYRRWCAEHPEHARGAHALTDMWSALSAAGAEIDAEAPAAARSWSGRATPTPTQGHGQTLRTGRRAFVGFAVAAGASWLALRPPLQLWPAVGDFAADYRTGTGEQRQLTLSDRVVVEMNTQTRINLLPAQSTQTASTAQSAQINPRGIDLLAGEAEIVAAAPSRARPGQRDPLRQVLVIAGPGRLQAQVARFNVRRSGDQVCVTCIAGSIAVEHPQRRLTLLAAQQLVYDARGVQAVTSADPATVTAWRRGVLVFDHVPLARVVDEINRYRPGKIILRNPALGDSPVQAQFALAKLDGAITMISQLYGAHVTRLPGNIVLLS